MNVIILLLCSFLISATSFGKTDRMKNDKPVFKVSGIQLDPSLDTSNVEYSNQFILLHNIGATLLLLGKNDRFYSYLARRWNINNEKKEVTFTLNDKARFSNGDKITAKDVYYTFKRLMITGARHLSLKDLIVGSDKLKSMNDPVEGIKVIDEHTIVFRFKNISSLTLYLFTLPDSSIVSQKQVASKSLKIKDWSISSGPYFVKNSDKKSMHLSMNPHFLFQDPGMLEDIEIFESITDRPVLEDMEKEKLHYTFSNYFANPEDYEFINNSKNITSYRRNYCGTFKIILNKKLPPFDKKENRQIIYRYIRESNLDARPVKDDNYFVLADHLLLPTTLGRPSAKEIQKKITSYPADKSRVKTDFQFKWVLNHFDINKQAAGDILSLFKKLGISIEMIPYENPDQWVSYANYAPFLINTLFINEKELQQTFEYLNMKSYNFGENRDDIMALNKQLAGTSDPRKKAEIINSIATLITDDSIFIPLYYIIHHDFIHKDYEILDVNEFSSTPKLWKIRRKKKTKE